MNTSVEYMKYAEYEEYAGYAEYGEWSAQYMKEAEILRERVERLRTEARGIRNSDEADRLSWRAAMLYGMYLDCLHTGRLLAERSHPASLPKGDKEGTPRLLVKKEHKYSAEKTAGRGRKEGAA